MRKKSVQPIEINFVIKQSLLDKILIAMTEKGICAIFMDNNSETLLLHLKKKFPRAALIAATPKFEKLADKVIDFIKAPAKKHNFMLDVIQGTPFQQRVWQALSEIPVGATISYAELAQRIGMPKAVRAAANACGANPIAIFIPCHRVIKTNGSLSGYRWGVVRKHRLLNSEKNSGKRKI